MTPEQWEKRCAAHFRKRILILKMQRTQKCLTWTKIKPIEGIKMDKPTELKKCPCGQVPGKLLIFWGDSDKNINILGDCCGKWAVPFEAEHIGRTENAKGFWPAVCLELTTKAWNDAPRGEG